MKFNVGNRELDFDVEKKIITYKDKVFTPAIRTYGDMEKLFETKLDLDKNEGLYFMFRDVYFNETEKKVLDENNMRYDITILIPKLFGNELNKTYGHYHPKNKAGNDYREIYQVLNGDAIYLQQNKDEAYYTKANTGNQVIMETGFGHVTINPSSENYLIMANYVEAGWDSIYNEYREFDGANHLYKKSGFDMNLKYNNSLDLSKKDVFFANTSMYDDFFDNPEKFNFLH